MNDEKKNAWAVYLWALLWLGASPFAGFLTAKHRLFDRVFSMQVPGAAYIDNAISTLFAHWFWDKIIFAFFLSILTGTIGANLSAFRMLQRQAYDEVAFLRRRIYPEKGANSSSPVDWEHCYALLDSGTWAIDRELKFAHFHSAAGHLQRVFADFSAAMRAALDAGYAEVRKRNVDRRLDDEQLNKLFDEIVRPLINHRVVTLIDPAAIVVSKLRPDFWAVVDAPKFGAWWRKGIRFFRGRGRAKKGSGR